MKTEDLAFSFLVWLKLALPFPHDVDSITFLLSVDVFIESAHSQISPEELISNVIYPAVQNAYISTGGVRGGGYLPKDPSKVHKLTLANQT